MHDEKRIQIEVIRKRRELEQWSSGMFNSAELKLYDEGYRLYTLCERKKRAAEAMSYNGLVQSWPEIMRLAQEGGRRDPGMASWSLGRSTRDAETHASINAGK